MIDRIYFDLETGPQPYRVIEGIVAYDDSEGPKMGNAKSLKLLKGKRRNGRRQRSREKSSTMGRYTRVPL